MRFDFIVEMIGVVLAWLLLVYYRIRHPFTWEEKLKKRFIDKYHTHSSTKMMYLGKGTHGRVRIGGDCSVKDATNLTDTIHSFTLGNSLVSNSKGEYISVKLKGGEV